MGVPDECKLTELLVRCVLVCCEHIRSPPQDADAHALQANTSRKLASPAPASSESPTNTRIAAAHPAAAAPTVLPLHVTVDALSSAARRRQPPAPAAVPPPPLAAAARGLQLYGAAAWLPAQQDPTYLGPLAPHTVLALPETIEDAVALAWAASYRCASGGCTARACKPLRGPSPARPWRARSAQQSHHFSTYTWSKSHTIVYAWFAKYHRRHGMQSVAARRALANRRVAHHDAGVRRRRGVRAVPHRGEPLRDDAPRASAAQRPRRPAAQPRLGAQRCATPCSRPAVSSPVC